MKAGPGETVAIIESRAAQVIRAFAIDQKFDAFLFDNRIAGLLGIERHLVLEAGATALGDAHAQPFTFVRGLALEQNAKLTHGVIGHVDHRSYEIIASLGQVKPGPVAAAQWAAQLGAIAALALRIAKRLQVRETLAVLFLRNRKSKL